MDTTLPLDQALHAVGQLLARRAQSAAIVVVGGTALNLLQVVVRATRDVDVIATATPRSDGPPSDVLPPEPLPKVLSDAIQTVARDLGLPSDWLNTTVGAQWKTGLPLGFASRVIWHADAGLWVGVAGRLDLIYLKLYAAADDISPASRHFTDLLALRPTADELAAARTWITETQDPSPTMAQALQAVTAHVRATSR
jgi:uncharacterized nucleotidyltransferase DUF6036